MEFHPLHSVPEYMNECAEVLNEEWKRSLTARLHSLEKSRDEFPVCLVLLDKSNNGSTSVIGHSMLSVVRGQTCKSCLVESVVVRKSLRGKGFGRIIMQKTEQFAARQGYEVMYLTTHDKQKFYEHLGYEYCSPVISVGSGILPESLANKLVGSLNLNTQDSNKTCNNHSSEQTNKNNKEESGSNDNVHFVNLDINTNSSQPVTVAPPPPPPPVAPPPPANKTSGKLEVSRWDPSMVSWMKKKIS
ncbi:Acetyltransferase (GNAT) domain [Mactra antiquata]